MNRFLYINGLFRDSFVNSNEFNAIAVNNGIIEDTGSADYIIKKYKNYEVIDLQNHLVLPGFTDSHIHFTAYSLKLERLNLDNLSFEDIIKNVKEKVGKTQPGEWIVGQGWNKNIWKDASFPNKSYLDYIAPDNPVCLESRDYHSLWVNSKALSLLKNSDSAKSHPLCQKDPAGNLTGIFFEDARRFIYEIIPEPNEQQKISALQDGIKNLHRQGITAIHTFESLNDMKLLFQLNNFPLRIYCFVPQNEMEFFLNNYDINEFNTPFFRFSGFKFFVDGALGSQTALMFEPYCNDHNNFGQLCINEKELEIKIRTANKYNIPCAIHAIGDKANHIAVDTLNKIDINNKIRNRIEHAQLVRNNDFYKFKNAIVSAQPIHIREDIEISEKYWGNRSSNAFPFRELLNSGAVLAFGSDAPVETPSVFEGIYAALTRTKRNNFTSWHPEHCLNIKDAIKAYTINAAYAVGSENLIGSFHIGKRADFIVLSENIYKCKLEYIPSIKVLMVIIDGRIVFSD